MLLDAAVIELLDNIDHQRVSGEVAVVVVDGPVNVEQPEAEISAILIDEPSFGPLIMQTQIVVPGIGESRPPPTPGISA